MRCCANSCLASLSLVYYASQNLASGIISIVFGLTPIMTGVFALILLKDKFFSVNKILGLLLEIVPQA
jgi:drug/metabolite transporter (DMT)-like permease